MPSVLGIIASTRKLGNTELMVRVALEGAEESGADTEILRLTDFDIRPCNGCLTCVLKDKDCPQGDEAEFVLRKILSADGLVFSAPVYFLSPAGPAKLLADRMFMLEHLAPERPQKPAAVIVTLGRERGWNGFSVPLLASPLLFAGFWITDALLAPSPGPGEILLRGESVERARGIGRNLLSAQKSSPLEDTRCPICFGEAFELREGRRVECPICWVRGEVIGTREGKGLIRFDDDWPAQNRWIPESMRDHMNKWVRATQQRFVDNLEAIREARAPFKEKPAKWVMPIGPKP